MDILRENGKVLWGQWRKPGGSPTVKYSTTTKNFINTNEETYIYLIGQTTVWKAHVDKVLTTAEVIEQHIEYLIPSYYDINTEVYCWYLFDDILDYGNTDILTDIYSSGGHAMVFAHQIPGNNPWGVYSTSDVVEKKYIPKKIPRVVNRTSADIERSKLSAGLRYDILKRDNFRCCICGRNAQEDGIKLHVDHIMPVSKGGLTIPENLRTLCSECNLGKSNKIEE